MVALVMLTACVPLFILSAISIDRSIRPASRFRNSKLLSFFESGSAWFLGLAFVSGGLSKLMPFPGVMGPVWLEEVLAEHGLGLFGRFIAWSEAIIGLLLLAKHTRVLGSIMMVPMLVNILMVTVSLNWRGTPWVIVFFLANNLFLLAFHFNRWRAVIDSTYRLPASILSGKNMTRTRNYVLAILGTITLAPLAYLLDYRISTAMLIPSFIGLIWIEWITRFTDTNPATQ